MALESSISNGYDPSQGFAGGIRNLGTILSAGPMMRARGNLVNAETQRYGALAQQAGANADLTEAKRADLIRKGSLVDRLQAVYPRAEANMAKGNFADPSVDEYLGAASALTGLDKGDLAKFTKQSLGTRLAAQGNPGMAADVENPVSTANNRRDVDERANRPIVAGQGSTVFNPQGGILAQAGANVPPSNVRTAPAEGTNAPAIEARGVVPSKSTAAEGVRSELASKLIQLQAEGKIGTNTVDSVTSGLSAFDQNAKGGTPAPAAVPQGHVDYLKAHPETAADFDAKYGTGAAARILGQ